MSGIFGLSGAYDRNLSGLIPEKTRPTFREYGYFAGGRPAAIPGTALLTVDRIDYSNDTVVASARGNLPTPIFQVSGSGNTNYGWIYGGRVSNGVAQSQVQRIDYSNDLPNTIPRGNLFSPASDSSSAGNLNFGYVWYGKVNSSTSFLSRINYSNDLVTSKILNSRTDTTSNDSPRGVSNSNYAYFGGSNTFKSRVERIAFSNDTIKVSIRGPLSLPRKQSSATGNSNFGYYGGGIDAPIFSTVDRIDYSNDTAKAIERGSLSLEKNFLAATGNSNFGYFSGGLTPSSTSLVNRIDYSNDTIVAPIRGPLSSTRYALAATSSASFGGAPNSQYGVFAKYPYGYFIGGSFNGAAAGAKVNRLSFDNDTANASERGSLTNNVAGGAAVSSSNYFYSISGYSASGGALSFVERQDFSNDTSTATVRSRTSLARGDLAAEGNSSYGWIGGGGPNFGAFPYYSTIDRIDYSNDSVNARLRSFLTIARLRTSATGTSNFGYFGAGSFSTASPFLTKRVDRLNHSNDTINPLIRGDLFTLATKRAGTGTANFGYFGGGYSTGGAGAQTSAIDRIDYSNDTATAIQRASILVGRGGIGATGDNNKGYFGGGDQYASGFPYYSTIERLDYSNDTQTQLKSILYDNPVFGQPSLGRTNLSATSALEFGGAKDFQATQTFFDIQSVKSISDTTNYSVKKRALGSFGYFMSGPPTVPASDSQVSRIDYSNDTATGLTRGNTRPSHGGAAISNSNYAYLKIGWDQNPNTFVDRIDFSNDNVQALSRGNVTAAGPWAGSAGNLNFGYFVAGYITSIIDRIDYSNDSAISLPRGNLRLEKFYHASTYNLNFGYFGGGKILSPVTDLSSIERISYSNDTSISSVRGSLSTAIYVAAATGNSYFGWFGGGLISGVQTSSVERIDYSNDTANTSLRGILTESRAFLAATGNSDFGWFGGGKNLVLTTVDTVDRIDYSNDTTTASFRSNLGLSREQITATTNARNS